MRRPAGATHQDLAAWRRLLQEARACANNPARPTGDLCRRVEAAHPRPAPSGAEERANPWFALISAARLFCRASKSDRERLARPLAELCAACPQDALGARPLNRRHADARLPYVES